MTRRLVENFDGEVRFDRLPSPPAWSQPDTEHGDVTDGDGVRLIEYGWLDADHAQFYVKVNKPIVNHTVSTSKKRYQYYLSSWSASGPTQRDGDWTWEPRYIGDEDIGGQHEVVSLINSTYAVYNNPEISSGQKQYTLHLSAYYVIGEPYITGYHDYSPISIKRQDGESVDASFKMKQDGSVLKVYDVKIPDGYAFKGWQFLHDYKIVDTTQEELDAIANAGTEHAEGFVATHAFDKNTYQYGVGTSCWVAMILQGGGEEGGEPGNGELLYVTSTGRLICRSSDGRMLYWGR